MCINCIRAVQAGLAADFHSMEGDFDNYDAELEEFIHQDDDLYEKCLDKFLDQEQYRERRFLLDADQYFHRETRIRQWIRAWTTDIHMSTVQFQELVRQRSPWFGITPPPPVRTQGPNENQNNENVGAPQPTDDGLEQDQSVSVPETAMDEPDASYPSTSRTHNGRLVFSRRDRKRLIRKRVEALQASITAHNANGELHHVRAEEWITAGKPESQMPELLNTQKQLEQRQGDLKAEFEYLRAMGVRISWVD